MKITNWRKIDKGGSLVASFDVEFRPLTVRGMMLFRRDDGGMFIGEPSERYDKDGETKYRRHVVITDEEIKAELEAKAKKLWRMKQDDQPATGPGPEAVDHPSADIPF